MARVRSPQFLLLFLPLILFAGSEAHTECQQTRCGHHGPLIRFPFYLKDKQPQHCGFPGFHLSCTNDHQTLLELPSNPVPARLYLSSVDYKSQKITVYDPQNCLATQILRFANSSSATPFRFNIFSNVSFLSCPSSPCGIDAFDFNDDIEYSNFIFCTKILDVPFPSSRDSSYYYSFRLGSDISMAWSKPDCTKCEKQGMLCGLMNNATRHDQIACFPSPGLSNIKLAGIILGSIFFESYGTNNETF